MAFKPTPEQELAINSDGSILVSAAAGSGKTAVLVERVVRLLTDSEHPISADKILVVTFTNASAAELRLRIDKRLNEEFEKQPDNQLLRRQKMLVQSAKFCTIDSFCINFIKENFEAAGINPSFKIADRATISLIERTAMSAVINDCFDKNDAEFLNLLSFLGEDYDDSKVQSKIMQIVEFSHHLPFPKLWFSSIVDKYKAHAEGNSDEWFSRLLGFARESAIDALIKFKSAISYLETNSVAYDSYIDNYSYFRESSEKIIELCDEGKWDETLEAIATLSAPRLKGLSADNKTEEVLYSVKLRDEGKKLLAGMRSMIYADKEELREEIKHILPHITKLMSLCEKYEDTVNALLAEKNLMTFSLIEQTAFKVLAEVQDEKIIPSKMAEEYIKLYSAVLVDEYQDTNSLQDTLFGILSDGGKNLFCVGDIKQSIYRFRGSNPLHFLHKKEIYKGLEDCTEGDGIRIDLGCNFRSRPEICEEINKIFSKLITKESSGFSYDEKEMLVPKATFPESSELKTEYHIVDFDSVTESSNEEYDARIFAEADIVADTVLDTVGCPPFIRNGDELRRAEFGDITILVRAMKNNGEVYINALKKRGIPVSVSASDIVDTDEVKTLLSILRIINNPSDDVALLTVMTSPLFAFSMDELAKIRAEHKCAGIISSITLAAKKGDKKAKDFLSVIARLRYNSIIMSVGQLIDDIFDRTNLLNIMSCRENGDVKRLNLLGVLNFANSFEADCRRGLSAFINHFDNITDKDFTICETGGGNSVTVMTIHHSKGLQFPVCILANTSHQFNFMDTRSASIVNEGDGFSTTYYEDGVKNEKFILRSLMRKDESRELLAEELRLFYVALTRAEEKLIIFSSFKNLEASVKEYKNNILLTDSIDRIEYALFRKNKCYADWIAESLIIDNQEDALLGKTQVPNIIIHTTAASAKTQQEEAVFSPNENNVNALKMNYSYKYPYADLTELESKASVTALLHKADEDKYRFTERPAFLNSGRLTSAEKGIVVHKVMQNINLERAVLDLDGELDRLYENLYLTEEELNVVDKNAIITFLQSKLCERIVLSNSVRREMKFLVEFPATELKPELDRSFCDEMIVVQGAVDLLFEENGHIIIVDFKTDRNKDEAALREAYEEQLKMYAKACEKVLKMPVEELIIYSFSQGKEIIL